MNDEAARISDQSFSNFLIKYVFIEKKIIPLNLMMETCFQINESRTIEACNILLNVFPDKEVVKYVEQQMNVVWDKLESDTVKFPPFFKAFHIVRPTQPFLILQNRIEKEIDNPFDVKNVPFKYDQPGQNVSDEILQILSSYEGHAELSTALELLLLYFKKRPDLYEQFYSVYVDQFGVTLDSASQEFVTQTKVVKKFV